MFPIPPDLDGALALNICRTREGQWQASLEVSTGTWRIRTASTPSEAVAALFGSAELPPPLPY